MNFKLSNDGEQNQKHDFDSTPLLYYISKLKLHCCEKESSSILDTVIYRREELKMNVILKLTHA